MFGIANDILVICYDAYGKDHDSTLWTVLLIYRELNLKSKKDVLFQMFISPIFGQIISIHGMEPDKRKLKALIEMPPTQKVTANIPWNT